jgi:hypothetical protein
MTGSATVKLSRLSVINRTCWPEGQVIGEALRSLAVGLSENYDVEIVGQSTNSELKKWGVNSNVRVKACGARAKSSSGLFARIIDALIFGAWVFARLACFRPKLIYVATDPPVIVPFLVAVYCRVVRAKFIYHVQDIHPEIANGLVKIHPVIFKGLRGIDCFSLRSASLVVTLSLDMEEVLRLREPRLGKTTLVQNPALPPLSKPSEKSNSFVFCGNAGRVQLIPELLAGIELYLKQGGALDFSFAGGGVYSGAIQSLADKYVSVIYHGVIPSEDAMVLLQKNKWALIPISAAVSGLAFPSKTSSCLMAGCKLIVISERQSSVGKWAESQRYGVSVGVEPAELAKLFHDLECKPNGLSGVDMKKIASTYSIENFVKNISNQFQQLD